MNQEKEPPEILAQMDFFRDFYRSEIQEVLAAGQWFRFAPGQTIIAEGENDLFFYILVRGRVKVVKNKKTLATLRDGDSFGEIGAMAKTPRTAYVITQSECYCLRFDPQRIEGLPTDVQVKLLKKLLYSLAERLTSLNRRFAVL